MPFSRFPIRRLSVDLRVCACGVSVSPLRRGTQRSLASLLSRWEAPAALPAGWGHISQGALLRESLPRVVRAQGLCPVAPQYAEALPEAPAALISIYFDRCLDARPPADASTLGETESCTEREHFDARRDRKQYRKRTF